MTRDPKWKSLEQPEVGSVWEDRDRAHPMFPTARVMAYAEGYVMARFKGGMPFLRSLEDWHARFARMDPLDARRAGRSALARATEGAKPD